MSGFVKKQTGCHCFDFSEDVKKKYQIHFLISHIASPRNNERHVSAVRDNLTGYQLYQ